MARKKRPRGMALTGEIPEAPPRKPRRAAPIPGGRTVTEYRVTWQREGWSQKSVIFKTLHKAMRRIGVMTSDTPWIYWGLAADAGNLLTNDSKTVAEEAKERRERMPPLSWLKLETRQVTRTKWAEEPIDVTLPRYEYDPAVQVVEPEPAVVVNQPCDDHDDPDEYSPF